MAKQQQVTTLFTDDLDGSELGESAASTVQFALDGVSYEIDLSQANATALREDLSTWVGHRVAVVLAENRADMPE